MKWSNECISSIKIVNGRVNKFIHWYLYDKTSEKVNEWIMYWLKEWMNTLMKECMNRRMNLSSCIYHICTDVLQYAFSCDLSGCQISAKYFKLTQLNDKINLNLIINLFVFISICGTNINSFWTSANIDKSEAQTNLFLAAN